MITLNGRSMKQRQQDTERIIKGDIPNIEYHNISPPYMIMGNICFVTP